MLNKLQQKVTKLQSSLNLQMHMQTELESELKEKNKEIDARGNEVSVLNIKSSDKNDPKLTAPEARGRRVLSALVQRFPERVW